jgi:metalloendopeptidase OMA1, mitochondrial
MHTSKLTAACCAVQREDFQFLLFSGGPELCFSVAPGMVLVSDCMLELLKTDDQLAFIIAHEIGHLVARHSGESITRCALACIHHIARSA